MGHCARADSASRRLSKLEFGAEARRCHWADWMEVAESCDPGSAPSPASYPLCPQAKSPSTRSWEVPRASLTSCLPRAVGALHLTGLRSQPTKHCFHDEPVTRCPLPEPTPLHLQTPTTVSHRPPRLPAACRTKPTLLGPPWQAPSLPWAPVCACAHCTEASWHSAQPQACSPAPCAWTPARQCHSGLGSSEPLE